MKKVLVLAFVSLSLLFASCRGTIGQSQPQLTLKDSLLLELKGFLGDTLRTLPYYGGQFTYEYAMPTNSAEAYQLDKKIANRFDKLIRVPRTKSKLLQYYGDYTESYYNWENYDYEIFLYIMYECKNKNNLYGEEVVDEERSYKLKVSIVEK